jgi:asparagine synthase (glutamine-hydrolysing)
MFAAVASLESIELPDCLRSLRAATGAEPFACSADAASIREGDAACTTIGNVAAAAPSAPLPVVTRRSESRNVPSIAEMNTPFAFVRWDHQRRELEAARDHMGLLPLYYRADAGSVAFADTIDALAGSSAFDGQYIADFIAGRGMPNTDRTIRTGVRAVPPGTRMRWKDGRLDRESFWKPIATETLDISRGEASIELRRLLVQAVSRYVEHGGRTWSHLSGGIDSSSIVSLVQSRHEEDASSPALGGALTFNEPVGATDDGGFVRAVLERYPMHHVEIPIMGPWHADGEGPPLTDRPSRDYPFYARDRAAAAAVRANGGTTLLSGIGPDIYLPKTARHCPDLLWSGRLISAAREIHGWTVATRGSFVRVAWTHGVQPLFTRQMPGAVAQGLSTVAQWFTPKFRRDTGLDIRLNARNRMDGQRGHFYAHQIADSLAGVAEGLAAWRFTPGYAMAHPLLDRQVVEFCLKLPLTLKTDVYWSKPALRGAMKGILPESVRRRAGGSVLSPLIQEGFRTEQRKLLRLLRDPILAELGCIEPARVREALTSFDVYRTGAGSYLYSLLSMETWLAKKTGRWSES